MKDFKAVANPGSALGEAIGASMERSLEQVLTQISDDHGCHYVTSGVRKTRAGRKAKKLLLSDKFGNEYDIDGVIANEYMQPLIIFESKYIWYKKHNRDKGSWVCHAHSAIRRRYHSIRSSIAVLAGNWSQSSLAMMKSHDINLFLIPFDLIRAALAEHGIDFEWGEKERDKAYVAWERYNQLSESQQAQIGAAMIQRIANDLAASVAHILDDSATREVDKVVIELVSSFGEMKIYEFDSVDDAIDFLNQENLEKLFVTGDSASLFDPPPTFYE